MGCICCANGNDVPDGEYCRACGHGFEKIVASLHGKELDTFLRAEGFDPDDLLQQFNAVFPNSPM